jgi:hypothetical protein
MQKIIIGTITACALCLYAVPANAAVAAQTATIKAIQKAKTLAGKACDGAANLIWRNKGAVMVGSTAVAVATKPEVFVGGLTTLATSSYFVYLLIAGLVIVGVRYFLHRVGLWKVLPLLALSLLLCGGVAEAGVFDCIPVPIRPWWDIVMLVIVVLTMFL